MSDRKRGGRREVNLNELSEYLDCSLPTLRAMIRDNSDFPVLVRGGLGRAWVFDVDAVLAWRQRQQLATAEKANLVTPAQAKAYWESVRIQDDVRLRRGELVEKGPERAVILVTWTEFRKRLQRMHLQYSKDCEHSRADRIELEKRTDDLLNAFATDLRNASYQKRLLEAAG